MDPVCHRGPMEKTDQPFWLEVTNDRKAENQEIYGKAHSERW